MQGRIGVAAGGAAVDVAGDAAEVVGLRVAARCGEGEQYPGRAGHAAEPGTGRRQHEPADPRRCLMGELLGQNATERHAEHVDVA